MSIRTAYWTGLAAMFAAVTALPGNAEAGKLAVEAGLSGTAAPSGRTIEVPGNVGLYGQFGYRLDVGPLELTPELKATYETAFAHALAVNVNEVESGFQVLGGARLGVDLGGLVPSAYLHFGVGSIDVSGPGASLVSGPAGEVGLAVDLRLLSLLAIGAHLEYEGVRVPWKDSHELLGWARFGVHASVAF